MSFSQFCPITPETQTYVCRCIDCIQNLQWKHSHLCCFRLRQSFCSCWHVFDKNGISFCLSRCCTINTWWCVLAEAGRRSRAICWSTTRVVCSRSLAWKARYRPSRENLPASETSRPTATWWWRPTTKARSKETCCDNRQTGLWFVALVVDATGTFQQASETSVCREKQSVKQELKHKMLVWYSVYNPTGVWNWNPEVLFFYDVLHLIQMIWPLPWESFISLRKYIA